MDPRPDRRAVLGGLLGSAAALAGAVRPAAAGTPAPLSLAAAPLPGTSGTGFAYAGATPGPTIRVRLGQEVAVRLENHLEAPTSLTWHGVRIDNRFDGVAGLTGQPLAPGASQSLAFTPPDAGTFWYHPHVDSSAAAQVRGGLYGALIVEEASPPPVDADLPLIFGEGPSGAVLVGGKAEASAQKHPPGARLRLRLVNACPSRIVVLAFTGAVPSIVAIDGQPSALSQPAGAALPLAPGARFDLMLDLPVETGGTFGIALRDVAGARLQPLFEATTSGKPLPRKPPIAALPENPKLPQRIALQNALRREIAIAPAPGGRWSLGGVTGPAFDRPPLFKAKRGSPVSLTLRNASDVPQTLLVHGHCWRLLHDLDDGWDPYWRDSVLLAPGKVKHVAFVADNPGKWALESADLERLAGGLSTWFQVI